MVTRRSRATTGSTERRTGRLRDQNTRNPRPTSYGQDVSGAYRTLNRALLGLIGYCLAVPFLLLHAGSFLPAPMRQCASIRLFNRPCPLCGLTRGVDALMHGDIVSATHFHILSVPTLLFLLAEAIFRLVLACVKLQEPTAVRVRKWDGRIHLALLLAYLAYTAVFYALT